MMKKHIKTFLIASFISVLCYSQNTESFSADAVVSVKTPDVAAFESVNFLPVNEYTGRVDITIPIHTIELDGLKIPISISYNSGGVKVNSIASRVGLNWSLHAGGVVSREIKGRDDIRSDYGIVEGVAVYSEYGFLIENFTPQQHEVWEPGRDGQPDLFFAAAPGLNTVFTHKPNAEPLELTPKENQIATITEELFPNWHFFNEINITSPRGFIYSFKDKENSKIGYSEYPSEDALAVTGSDASYTYASSLHLSSITNPISKRSVTFAYDSLRVENHDLYTTRRYTENKNLISKKVFNNDYIDVQLIKKITFDSGEINFYYTDDRLDLIGDKRLTSIEVKDHHGNLIKKVHFVQDYFQSSDGCNDPECLRLRLDEVYFTDANANVLPGYTFTYDQTNLLPKRRSYKQDFLGYYNGASSSAVTKFVPQVYYKADQGRNSILPFNVPGLGYQALQSTYSITSDINYATSASLTAIEYPTGGSAQFEYELNSFSFLGHEIQGGGLRLKTHRIFNRNAVLEREMHYSYQKEDGSSSGSILFVPHWAKFSDGSLSAGPSLEIHQRSLNGYELTKNSYVGYSRVKIYEPGNGYTVKTFTSPETVPNSYSTDFEYTIGGGEYAPPKQQWLDKRIANGTFPNLWQSHEIQRGNLLSESIYDQADNLLKKTEHQYAYTPYDSIATHDNLYYPSGYTYYDVPHYVRANSVMLSERNVLVNTLVTDYLENGNAVTESDYFYEDPNTFLTAQQQTVTGGKLIKKQFYYPYHATVSSLPNVNRLIDLNILANAVQTETYRDAELLSTTRTYYDDWGNDRILPDSIAASFSDEALEIQGRFLSYDAFGNPLEVIREDDTPVSFIWGYQNTRPIVKLEGVSYADINPGTIISLKLLSDNDTGSTTEENLRNQMNALRVSHPDALITTFTYDPLVGLTSITDSRGYTSYYNYDGFSQLANIKDAAGNILKIYRYNYAGHPIQYDPLNVVINYGAYDTDNQWFSANVSAGSGNYSYAWYNGIGDSSTDFEANASGTADTYQLMVDCADTKYVKLIVTDNITGEVTQQIKVSNTSCNYPPLNVSINYGLNSDTFQGFNANVSGGSGDYSYAWHKGVGTSSFTYEVNVSSTLPVFKLFVDCSTSQWVKLVITDTITGQTTYATKQSNNSPCSGGGGDPFDPEQ